MQATNQCCQCGHEWRDRPMGFARHLACPACGSAYWVWLDYPDDSGNRSSATPTRIAPAAGRDRRA